MFAVIYKFKLKPAQEKQYQEHWHKIADFLYKPAGLLILACIKGRMVCGLLIPVGLIKPPATHHGLVMIRPTMISPRIYVIQ